VPSDATVHTAQGAEAFVRFYFEQLNLAFSTSDPEIVRALSHPECGTCSNYAKALAANRNEVIQGKSFAVTSAAAAPLQREGTFVEVFGRIPARRLVDRTGKVLRALPDGGAFHFSVAALRTASGWTVRAIKIESS
jgi:hypothetical protein